MEFLKITASGSPFDIGEKHGRTAKEKIAVSIETYKNMFKEYNNLDWEIALEKAKQFIPVIEKFDRDLLEEIRGVAAGAERKLEEIVALNARSELSLTQKMLEGCTTLAAVPPATAGGETYIAQNWDWKSSQKETLIILKIQQQQKPDVLMVTEAGIIGKMGFNSKGIGVGTNALISNKHQPGVPLHLVLRAMLNAETMGEAVGTAVNSNIASAVNFMIVHKDGEALDLEVLPGDFDYFYPENGLLTHTNHFTTGKMRDFEDFGRKIFPDSLVRLNRVNNLLRSKRGKIERATIESIMRDHFNYPESICRHVNERVKPEKRLDETVFSMIMCLSKGELYLSCGPPCRHKYFKETL